MKVSNVTLNKLFQLNGQNILNKYNYKADQYNYPSNHSPARCDCFFCQRARGETPANEFFKDPPPRDLEPWQYPNNNELNESDSKISSNPSTTNFYGKSSSEVANLTFDSLGALNSPYIDGTFVAAKWGSIDPDSGTTTQLSYYITPAGVTLSDGSTSVASTAAERSAIAIANAAFTDVANLSLTGITTLQAGVGKTYGIAFFGANSEIVSTATPSVGIQTTNLLLTVDENNVPVWTDSLDGGFY